MTEAFALLLAYGCAVEKILADASGGGGTLPGHRVSLRSYVEQLLRGEAPAVALQRLESYFADAVAQFTRKSLSKELALQQYADQVVEAIKPSRIEQRVQPGALSKVFGLHERAYWREYKKEFHHLDVAAVKQLARKGDGS